jgi:hypothetical protein
MSEDLVYSKLLDKAARCSSTLEEAAYVAAYVNSAYASTATRIGKPFNPMLYETFEWDRRAEPEYGWRVITEQVGDSMQCGGLPFDPSPTHHTGKSSPSNVCHACGAQGLDILARIHCCLEVPWPVLGVLSFGGVSPGDAHQQESLHLDKGHNYHPQHHRWKTVD